MPFHKFGVVAYAFGTPATIEPNQRIAKMAATLATELSAPIFTQADIQIPQPTTPVSYFPNEDPDNPPPTLRIARAAVEWAMINNIDVLYVVCASPHRWRCMRDTKAAAKERGSRIDVRDRAKAETEAEYMSWFTRTSTQERTQTEEAWLKREVILKIAPFFIYKRMAK